MVTKKTLGAFVLVAFALSSMTGCAALQQVLQGGAGPTERPTMTYQSAQLVRSPSTTQLLSHYCPSLVPGAICTAALGRAPARDALRFDFKLNFQVNNPYTVPIPTLSMLLATTLFNNNPDAQELGAVCVSFCDPGDAACDGQASAGACEAGSQDIFSMEDFAGAATRELVNIATNGLDPNYGENLRVKTIPAKGSSDVKVVFTLGIDPMLNILRSVAVDQVEKAVQTGNAQRQIDIPYAVRGTLWFDLPANLGRYGLPFGPSEDVWQLKL